MVNYSSIVSSGSNLASTAQSTVSDTQTMINSIVPDGVTINGSSLSEYTNLNRYILIPELDMTSGGSFELPQWLADNAIVQALLKAFEWIMAKYKQITELIDYVVKMVRNVLYEWKMWLLQKLDSLVLTADIGGVSVSANVLNTQQISQQINSVSV
jgi:hypothetical protein